MTERIETLRRSLDKLQVDAMLVTSEVNVRYLSGFTGDSSYLLISADETSILSDGRYEIQIAQQSPTLNPIIRPPSKQMPQLLEEVFQATPYRRIGIEASQMSLSQYRFLCETCPKPKWVETDNVVEKQRMIKDSSEIATIRMAISIAERSFQSLLPMLSPKWTECEIAFELEARMRFLGAEAASFKPIVAFGAAAALPHYQPSDASMPSSGTVLIDWGAMYNGYASDLTRTLFISDSTETSPKKNGSDRDFAGAYEAVLEAQLAAIAKIRPGVEGKAVDAAAREVLNRFGLEDAFVHGLGHGFGLQIHESPRMSASCDQTLQSGMVLTVEPGVYLRDRFGIRIEDDVLVTESGCEVLSTLPKGIADSRLVL